MDMAEEQLKDAGWLDEKKKKVYKVASRSVSLLASTVYAPFATPTTLFLLPGQNQVGVGKEFSTGMMIMHVDT